MKINTKALIGTAAVGAMALSFAAPVQARDHRDDDDIDAGDVIAGAVIIGGIAALAGAFDDDDDRDYRDNRYYRGNRNGYYRGSARSAVQRCVNAVQRDARRNGYRYADVTRIGDVDNTRYGWRVEGRLTVDGSRGYGRRGNYNRNARYSWGDNDWDDRRNYRRSDRGKFTCRVERGRIRDIDYDNIRGLR